VAGEGRKGKKVKVESPGHEEAAQWWPDSKGLEPWLNGEPTAEFDTEQDPASGAAPEDIASRTRLQRIKESYELLRQFTPKELKVLTTLKRNTSPKAWTLREDLVVLTLAMSNREIADVLKDRNKEAVKKRLQLLKSKGLAKRQPESPARSATPSGG
jgi:hypothetical protein